MANAIILLTKTFQAMKLHVGEEESVVGSEFSGARLEFNV